MENTENEKSHLDFIKVAIDKINQKHKSGQLPYNIMIIVILYNLIFFGIEKNYGLYTFIPISILVIVHFSKYWEIDSKWRRVAGFVLINSILLWDFILSVSFMPNPLGGYNLLSIPTILLDMIAMLSAIYWWPTRDNEN